MHTITTEIVSKMKLSGIPDRLSGVWTGAAEYIVFHALEPYAPKGAYPWLLHPIRGESRRQYADRAVRKAHAVWANSPTIE